MRGRLAGCLLLVLLAVATVNQADVLRHRPVELKLGPIVSPVLVKMVAGEHCAAVAFRTVVRVMFYFGSFFEDNPNLIQKAPEYTAMYRHLKQAVELDPYNMDAYYFAQAAFTWEVGHARDVNAMLDYGMRYRKDDYLLPFYAGFNAAYFIKDYPRAARYFQMASERSGIPLFASLAARYFNEAGENRLALAYLDTMIKGAADKQSRLIYEKRRDALRAADSLEQAVARFREKYGQLPARLEELVANGFLPVIPVDPYGGTFYLDEQGRVRTTSKFALQSADQAPKTQGPSNREE